jgi:hypothetical protein
VHAVRVDIHESARWRESRIVASFHGDLVDPAHHRRGHDEYDDTQQDPSKPVPFC